MARYYVWSGRWKGRGPGGRSPLRSPRSRIGSVVWVWLLLLALAPMFAQPQVAAAGQTATVIAGGNPLFDAPDPTGSANVLATVAYGVTVDVLRGPVDTMYMIRYEGIDGWIWEDKLSLNGPGTERRASGGPERWIDVDRGTGLVTLYSGGESEGSYWGVMSKDLSDSGFYATAIGTYYVTEKHRGLSYTAYADAYVSHWVEFDASRDNGFHSYIKDKRGDVVSWGAAPTGGCVAMDEGPIEHLYNFAELGMRVEVHW